MRRKVIQKSFRVGGVWDFIKNLPIANHLLIDAVNNLSQRHPSWTITVTSVVVKEFIYPAGRARGRQKAHVFSRATINAFAKGFVRRQYGRIVNLKTILLCSGDIEDRGIGFIRLAVIGIQVDVIAVIMVCN